MREQKPGTNLHVPSKELCETEEAAPSAAICSSGISAARLRLYLFDEKESASPDPAVGQHLASGCLACDLQRRLLLATNPFLRDKVEFGTVHEEVIPSTIRDAQSMRSRSVDVDPSRLDNLDPAGPMATAEPDPTDGMLWHLKQELCQKLARAMASPAEPLSISQLRQMEDDLRSGHDAAREIEVQRIVRTCERRWARLSPDMKEAVEYAATQLMTAVAGGPITPGGVGIVATVGVELDGGHLLINIDSERSAAALLTYLMTRTWFLNPAGERLWDLQDSVPGQRIRVSLDLNSLRRSLNGVSSPSLAPPVSD